MTSNLVRFLFLEPSGFSSNLQEPNAANVKVGKRINESLSGNQLSPDLHIQR
jgi:hypothetical protein